MRGCIGLALKIFICCDVKGSAMAKSANATIARALVLLSIIVLIVAVILELLSFGNVHLGFGSAGGFLSGVLHGLAIVAGIILLLIFLAVNYYVIYERIGRKNSRARDMSLVFGIIEIIFALLFLPRISIASGILLLIAWLVLEL